MSIIGGITKRVPGMEVLIEYQEKDLNVRKLNELVTAAMVEQNGSDDSEQFIIVRTGGTIINDCPATRGR